VLEKQGISEISSFLWSFLSFTSVSSFPALPYRVFWVGLQGALVHVVERWSSWSLRRRSWDLSKASCLSESHWNLPLQRTELGISIPSVPTILAKEQKNTRRVSMPGKGIVNLRRPGTFVTEESVVSR
jgi:hypothetical protein